MTFQVIQISEGERDFWDRAVVQFAHAHPLNAFGWGKVREIDGWQPSYYMTKKRDVVTGLMMVLVKRIPWTGYSIMYAPKGPLCDPGDRDTLKHLLRYVREEAGRRRAIFLRIDPNIKEDRFDDGGDPFVREGFLHLEHRWSFWNSPRDVYRIDLEKAATEEDLFNSIDRDARRCVRKALKEGVTVRTAENIEDLHRFYEIFSEFTVGKGFMCRQLRYQESLWHEFIAKGNGRLFLAVYQGGIIGGLICIMFGKICLAMHMGTPPQHGRLHTYYAYLWESIRWAKERGCSRYSFRGVGTTPSQESFKRKFAPEEVALVGYYDLPYRPLLYQMFSAVEFEILPRIWRTLMRVRRGYARLAGRAKGMKLAPVRAE